MGAGEGEEKEAKLLFSYVGQVPRGFCLPLNCRQDKISPRLGIKREKISLTNSAPSMQKK